MTSILDSISNSSGASSVHNLFSFCFTYLKDSRPLSGTVHAVTSLIKPQEGSSLLFRIPPPLIAVGTLGLIAALYLLATKFFRQPPPQNPPEDLKDRTENVTPNPTDPNSGTGTGSLPTVQVNNEGGSSTVVTQPDAGVLSVVPIATTVDSSAESHILDNNQVQPKSTSESSSTNPSSEPISPSKDLPPSDHVSSERSDSESGSQSPTRPKPSTVERLVGVVTYFVSTCRHFTKWTKYRLIQEQLEQFARSKKVDFRGREVGDSSADLQITTTWNQLVEALLEPTLFETPDDQYRKTASCLRKTRQLLISSDTATKEKFAGQLQFVRELSYMRFAGIELFPYCQELIEYATGVALPSNLTLDNFQIELKNRTEMLKRPTESTTMNPVACQVNKLKGTANIYFDPLLNSNVPYRDGQITFDDMKTLILWHGTPVQQHDPYGLLFDLATGALSYIPYLSNLMPTKNPVSSPPVINADYPAFIEEAELKGQNILHIILENGTKKTIGDESGRVKARLRLAVYHKNFFAMALRLDGDFFERHDEVKDQAESIQSLKERLKTQLLMPLRSFEEEDLTVSAVDRKQMEDQLAVNGFGVPSKLRQACELETHIDSLLDEVEQLYFAGKEHIKTQEEHQAFIILSYAHIILFACWKMNISILEALCKDDKDRGNVIKTILKLHFLYVTNQINHETLTSVLVHVLARPFILQKAPIIKSRLVLLERVIPFIRAAYNKVPVPRKEIFGVTIENASYHVNKPVGQTICPNNATSKTSEEYRAFLKHHQPFETSSKVMNLMLKLVRELNAEGKLQDTLNISIDQHRLNPQTEEARTTISTFLTDRCNFTQEGVQRALCYFHEGLGEGLLTHLNGIFANQSLGISVKPSSNPPSIHLTEENKTAKLRFDAVFSICDKDRLYGTINGSMTTNVKTAEAKFEYALIAND
jgi:hypothetical protein